MEQPPVQIGQYVLGKNLGIGAFGKVRLVVMVTQGDTQSEESPVPLGNRCLSCYCGELV